MSKNAELRFMFTFLLVSSILAAQLANSCSQPFVNATSFPTPPPPLPIITIEANGTLNPSTGLIQRVENIYTLTNDLTHYTILIKCNNVTLDGGGFTLEGRGYWTPLFSDSAVTVIGKNVTIRNMSIRNFNTGIYIGASQNCTVTENTILCVVGIQNGAECSNSQYIGNNLTRIGTTGGVGLSCWGLGIRVAENNFVNFSEQIVIVQGANNTEIVGNYWSDYVGDDLNGDGIGDTPYRIWEYRRADDMSSKFRVIVGQDNYPLMVPFGSDSPAVVPTPTPEPQSGFYPNAFTVIFCVIALSLLCVILFFYFRKRRSLKSA